MTFLNSIALLALPLVTLPALIHLLAREKARVLRFSTLRFLRELEHSEIRNLRLREMALLVLRTLAILGLILMASRPAIVPRATPAGGIGSKTAALVILDDSFSTALWTGHGTVYDQGCQVVRQIAGTMSPDDAGVVVLARGVPFPAHQYRLSDAMSKASSLPWEEKRPLPVGNDPAEAFRLAAEWSRFYSTYGRELYWISDFVGPYAFADSSLLGPLRQVRTYLVPIQRPKVTNLSLTGLRLGSQIVQMGTSVPVLVHVVNTGDLPVRERLVQLFWEGEPVAQGTVSLAPGESTELLLRAVPRRSGWQHGSVVLEDDALEADNRLWFTVEVPDRIRVLVVSSAAEREAVVYALNPPGTEPGLYEVVRRAPGEVLSQDVRLSGGVILVDMGGLSPHLTEELVAWVRAGGCLIVFPGPNASPRDLTQTILSPLGLPPVVGTFGKAGSVAPAATVTWMDRDHPVFEGVFEEKEPSVSLPVAYFGLRLLGEEGLSVILRCSNGLPFLCERTVGLGKVFLFTSGLSPDWSDLARKGLFVALLQRLPVYTKLLSRTPRLFQTVGEAIEIVDERLPVGAPYELERPDGTRVRLAPQAVAGGTRLRYEETDVCGIYTISTDGQIRYLMAVNPDPREADLRPVDVDRLAKALGAEVLDARGDLPKAIALRRRGRELWPWLAASVLALLCAELIIGRTTAQQVTGKEAKQRTPSRV
ncbi:MAG: BatA domain-containing protein [candidate division KSB1 bacterium]|nr:BatA domain-containing protein [candidate division KSB1 bacterium]